LICLAKGLKRQTPHSNKVELLRQYAQWQTGYRQVLLDGFSNIGRPVRRVDRVDVMIRNFRAKDRWWHSALGIGPRPKHGRHRPGVWHSGDEQIY
jgi:hypothetical protein